MEKTIVQNKNSVLELKDINGVWKIEYKVINPMGASAFYGRGLAAYHDPETGRLVRRPKAGGGYYHIFMISRPVMLLNPEENIQDRLDIEWLINHPEIMVEGYHNYPGKYKNAKNTNSRIKLIALDHQEMENIQKENVIDKMIGRLSLEGGRDAIGLERSRYILAQLNQSYRDSRYISNPKVEKELLRKKLKDYVRSSYENALKFEKVVNEIDDAKDTYLLKEMIRLHVVEIHNGMYKFGKYNLGISVAGVKEKWNNDPDLKTKMVLELEGAQNAEK